MSQIFYKEFYYQDVMNILFYLSKDFSNHLLCFDSNGFSRQSFETGRYSYICFDPLEILYFFNNELFHNEQKIASNPFDYLKTWVQQNPKRQTLSDLPPFHGGFAGFFGYELLHTLEDIPAVSHQAPFLEHMDDMRLCLYDLVLAFDHKQQKSWLISSHPQKGEARLNFASNLLAPFLNSAVEDDGFFCKAPLTTIACDFSKEAYEECIQKTIDYIVAGDIFQANITRRLFSKLPHKLTPLQLYKRLRTINPAPFAGFFEWRSAVNPSVTNAILSSSPERFIQLSHRGQIETRPIKGTRKRSADAHEDLEIQKALLSSEKDNAENMMIVDLMRNDLSRVSKPHSVHVQSLAALETYQTVHHLVSTITSKLDDHKNAVDLLKATFPGGSISGAPKIRAMEIICELERARRGPYCGCLGYIGIDGAMDMNILIRTVVISDDHVSFHVGGGIVADSIPSEEYEETCVKANALMETLVS